MKKLNWQISAIQMGGKTSALAASLPHHLVYIAAPRLVLVLLDNDPNDDEGGNIMAAASEKSYRAMLHRDGLSAAESLARVQSMPRFNRLRFEQGIESRQTSYQPGGYGPFVAETLTLSASGMIKLAVIFAHQETKAATSWRFLSRFLMLEDRGNAMRFLDNVVFRHQTGKPVGSMVRFTLPEIARFDPAALAMMERIE